MAITLDGQSYSNVIGTEFAETKQVHTPEWINDASPDVDTNVWTEGVFRVTYVLRVTDAQKWALDQDLTSHATVTLVDSDYDINHAVWVRKIEAIYERGRNDTSRWRIIIELIYA
jgi:hypothetical protein